MVEVQEERVLEGSEVALKAIKASKSESWEVGTMRRSVRRRLALWKGDVNAIVVIC